MLAQIAAVYLPFRNFILNENIPKEIKKDTYLFAKTIIENSNDDKFKNKHDLILICDLDDLIQYMRQTDYINNIFSDIFIKYTCIFYSQLDTTLEEFIKLLFKTYRITDISYESIYHKMKENTIFRSLFVNYDNNLQLKPQYGYAYNIPYQWDINKPANFDKIKDIVEQLRNYYDLPIDLFQLIKARILDTVIRMNFNKKTRSIQENTLNVHHILYENNEIIITLHKASDVYKFVIFYDLKSIKNDISVSRLCTVVEKDDDYLSMVSFGEYPFSGETSIIADNNYNKVISLNDKYIIHIFE